MVDLVLKAGVSTNSNNTTWYPKLRAVEAISLEGRLRLDIWNFAYVLTYSPCDLIDFQPLISYACQTIAAKVEEAT